VLTVVKALGINKASLYLLDEVKGAFEVKSSCGFSDDASALPFFVRDDPLIRRLTSNRGALVREELQFAADGAADGDLAQKMGEINAEVTLPLVTKEKLIGLLNLGYKEGKEMYSDEDLELLSTLGNQAAVAIENARLYENLKQSQSIIRRADRLASLGQLTAGLAHEIRNPLVAIRTFTQLLPERYQDPEFRSSFQALAMKEVDRICGLVNDLLSFARPSAPNVSAENVNEIVESIARILETEAKEKGVQIYRRLAPSLPKIFVDKEQIKQVCMNVILNAIQAIDGRGVVQISTHMFAKSGGEQFVQIGIRDSGLGIAEKDLENIFNPFFTTKKEGSGLGLSISHQIVQEHGGYITVESKAGEGTTFFINLPAHYRNHQGITSRNKGSPSTP
ncbi:MAG: GAF domain-containing protein, partial [Deltaproteobacteria bacterium]|nr:GAF domain-containing protein [Deltaproteobacteria bacterium]